MYNVNGVGYTVEPLIFVFPYFAFSQSKQKIVK